MSSGKILLGILGGVAAGAVLGILFAPDKGSGTRKKISKKADRYAEDLKDRFNDYMDDMKEKFESFREDETEHEKTKRGVHKNGKHAVE
jgi:gas vesicle protein